mgnify:CR=1 FL=1
MSKRYAVSGPNQSAAAPQTMAQIASPATVRANIYDLLVGSSATPADQALLVVAGRITTLGTVTAQTPLPLDANDIASLCVGGVGATGITATAEPTYNAVFALNFGMNQRATFRWVAAPGGEVMSAAGAASGFGAKVHTSTATLIENCTVHWWE